MGDIERSLHGKLPARIVDTQPAREVEILTAPYLGRTDLVQAVRRQVGRHEVRPLQGSPTWNLQLQQWEFQVIRIKAAPPAWRRPLLISFGVGAVIAAFVSLGWWVLTSLAALPLGLLCTFAFAAICWIVRSGKSTSVRVETHTSVYVRTR